MSGGAFSELLAFLRQGGVVMWPLAAAAIVLWYMLGIRIMMLKRGSRKPLRSIIRKQIEDISQQPMGFIDNVIAAALAVRRRNRGDIRRLLDEKLFPFLEAMGRYKRAVRTIVLVAPLAGLLGTVLGMIEMFESLGSQVFYSQSGGVANGISQALLTTEFGLLIAVPGLIIGRLLDRQEDKMRGEIEQVKDYMCVSPIQEITG